MADDASSEHHHHPSAEAPDWVASPEPPTDWASLELGIVQQISARLPDEAHRVRVGHVCRRWRSAVSGDRGVMGRPWIVARRGRRCRRSSYAFLRLSCLHQNVDTFSAGATFRLDFDEVLAASRGWLAVRRGARVLLADPVSPAKVALPRFVLPGYRIKNVFLSGDSVTAPDWRAFAIAVYADGFAADVLAFCRRGDTSWTRIDDNKPRRRYTSLEFHKGSVYAIDDPNREMICLAGAGAATKCTRISNPLGGSFYEYRDVSSSMAWLVDCAGHLLLIQLEHSLARRRGSCCVDPLRRGQVGHDGYLGLYLIVRRLEMAEDGGGGVATAMVTDIGDNAVFVGESGHAFAVQASGLDGVRSNFLYYAGDMDDRMVAFDLRTYQYEPAPYSRRGVSVLAGKWRPLCWLCPRRPVVMA